MFLNEMQANYNEEILMYYKHNLYFESSVMILILVSVGKFLEAKAKNKTTEAIDLILNLAPDKVFIVKEDKEILINVSDVKKGDIIFTKDGKPGEIAIINERKCVDETRKGRRTDNGASPFFVVGYSYVIRP